MREEKRGKKKKSGRAKETSQDLKRAGATTRPGGGAIWNSDDPSASNSGRQGAKKRAKGHCLGHWSYTWHHRGQKM